MKIEKCPVCGKKAIEEFRPFCSKQCKNKDLINWATENYRIPSEDREIDDNIEKN